MKTYLVGGAVRDELLGIEPKDRDYVVVGETHESMVSRGFVQVGSTFPVYLEPTTKEEYALARTERSTGPGYHDFETIFTPDVTIQQDLRRRDLTINAIAKDLETGEYIDPFGGEVDIRNKTLRLVNKRALLEDPLRTYRLARLYARFGGTFKVYKGDMFYEFDKVKSLLAHLPKERKVAELNKCFSDLSPLNTPSRMIKMLTDFGEFPELQNLVGIPQPALHHPEGDAFNHTMLCIDYAHRIMASPEVHWAALCHDLGKVCYLKYGNLHGHEEAGVPYTEEICNRFGVPNTWRKLALVVTREHGRMHKLFDMKPRKVYDLMCRINAEKDHLFALKVIEACLCDARGRGPTKENVPYDQPLVIWAAVEALLNNRSEISEECQKIAQRLKGNPDKIRDDVRSYKVSKVRSAIATRKQKIKEYREYEPLGNIPAWRLSDSGSVVRVD